MTSTTAWVLLVIAGIFEVCWTIGIKYSEGFTKLLPSCLTVIAMIISMYLLGKATSVLPIGTAYGIWVGIGAVGAAVLGIIIFNETASPLRLLFISLLILSIVGLKLTSTH